MRARLASPAVEVGRERQVDEITGRGLAASALLRPRIACAMSAGPDEERCEESPLHTWRQIALASLTLFAVGFLVAASQVRAARRGSVSAQRRVAFALLRCYESVPLWHFKFVSP